MTHCLLCKTMYQTNYHHQQTLMINLITKWVFLRTKKTNTVFCHTILWTLDLDATLIQQLVNNLIKANNKLLQCHRNLLWKNWKQNLRFTSRVAYNLLRVILFRSSVTGGHSFFVLELGSHISHFLHTFNLGVFPTVQFQVFHFAYMDSHAPVHPGTSGANKNADIVRRPFWIYILKKKSQQERFCIVSQHKTRKKRRLYVVITTMKVALPRMPQNGLFTNTEHHACHAKTFYRFKLLTSGSTVCTSIISWIFQ